jgi:hypothetical protein
VVGILIWGAWLFSKKLNVNRRIIAERDVYILCKAAAVKEKN